MALKIITNNVPRFIIDACELSAREREEFDYLDWPAIDAGRDSASFVRYKGELYDLGNFMCTDTPGWDGVLADSFFSGLLIRFADRDCESVVIGYAYSTSKE